MLTFLKWLRAIWMLRNLKDPAHPAVNLTWVEKIKDWLLSDEFGNILTDSLAPEAKKLPSKKASSARTSI